MLHLADIKTPTTSDCLVPNLKLNVNVGRLKILNETLS